MLYPLCHMLALSLSTAVRCLGSHQYTAVQALKCMLLAKIMTGDSAEVPGIISSRASLKYAGEPPMC